MVDLPDFTLLDINGKEMPSTTTPVAAGDDPSFNMARAALKCAGGNLMLVDLYGASFLPNSNMANTDLTGADLSFANMDGINLSNCKLHGANIVNATMRNANLSKTDIGESNFMGTDLSGADMTGISPLMFTTCKWAGANLTGAKIFNNLTLNRTPLQILGLVYPVLITETHLLVSCQAFTFEEWEAMTDADYTKFEPVNGAKFAREWRDKLIAIGRYWKSLNN